MVPHHKTMHCESHLDLLCDLHHPDYKPFLSLDYNDPDLVYYPQHQRTTGVVHEQNPPNASIQVNPSRTQASQRIQKPVHVMKKSSTTATSSSADQQHQISMAKWNVTTMKLVEVNNTYKKKSREYDNMIIKFKYR